MNNVAVDYSNVSAFSQSAKDKKLRKTCQDFEAILMGYMLKSMRKASTPSGGMIKKSMGERVFTDMLDGEYSKIASRTNKMGLADMLYRQLADKNGKVNSVNNAINSYRQDLIRSNIPVRNLQTEGINESVETDMPLINRIKKYNHVINAEARNCNVDPNLIRAVIAQESRGVESAVSEAGAKGLMQLMDSTGEYLGVKDVFDPDENINAGVRYLREMLNRFDGDREKALASYNAGPAAVNRYGGIPPYPETQQYVKNVLKLTKMFKAYFGG